MEDVAATISDHEEVRNHNLGQWRSEIECSCGHVYCTDVHREQLGERQEGWNDHIATAVMAMFPAVTVVTLPAGMATDYATRHCTRVNGVFALSWSS